MFVFNVILNTVLKIMIITRYSVKYELTAYKQFLQLICLCKPLIK